jgi:hypothetical protein
MSYRGRDDAAEKGRIPGPIWWGGLCPHMRGGWLGNPQTVTRALGGVVDRVEAYIQQTTHTPVGIPLAATTMLGGCELGTVRAFPPAHHHNDPQQAHPTVVRARALAPHGQSMMISLRVRRLGNPLMA